MKKEISRFAIEKTLSTNVIVQSDAATISTCTCATLALPKFGRDARFAERLMVESRLALQRGHLELGNVGASQLADLKFLFLSIFPLRYSSKYFRDVLENEGLSFIARYKGNPVACLCSKREQDSIHISALGVLPAYRRLGIASLLVEHLIFTVKLEYPEVGRIYLHAQDQNAGAIKFYSKHSFVHEREVSNYYATSHSGPHKDAILFSRQL